MPIRFKKVDNGVYRGGKPSLLDLQRLSNLGIKTIISLDGMIGKQISLFVKKLGMEHLIIPLGDISTYNLIKSLNDNIINIINYAKPVYIHCRHGSDRTGMAIALYRIKHQGWTPDQAILEAKKFNFGNKLDKQTEKLYLNEILGDNNQAIDAVTYIRDEYSDSLPPAFESQQSFAPYVPIKETYYPPELRKEFFKKMLSNKLPSIGTHDNCCEGIRGAGPVEHHSLDI